MIVEVVTTNAGSMQSQQVSMETSHNGNDVDANLHCVGIGCGLLMDWVTSVGNCGSLGHEMLLWDE